MKVIQTWLQSKKTSAHTFFIFMAGMVTAYHQSAAFRQAVHRLLGSVSLNEGSLLTILGIAAAVYTDTKKEI